MSIADRFKEIREESDVEMAIGRGRRNVSVGHNGRGSDKGYDENPRRGRVYCYSRIRASGLHGEDVLIVRGLIVSEARSLREKRQMTRER